MNHIEKVTRWRFFTGRAATAVPVTPSVHHRGSATARACRCPAERGPSRDTTMLRQPGAIPRFRSSRTVRHVESGLDAHALGPQHVDRGVSGEVQPRSGVGEAASEPVGRLESTAQELLRLDEASGPVSRHVQL